MHRYAMNQSVHGAQRAIIDYLFRQIKSTPRCSCDQRGVFLYGVYKCFLPLESGDHFQVECVLVSTAMQCGNPRGSHGMFHGIPDADANARVDASRLNGSDADARQRTGGEGFGRQLVLAVDTEPIGPSGSAE